jgi:hypothetical protein
MLHSETKSHTGMVYNISSWNQGYRLIDFKQSNWKMGHFWGMSSQAKENQGQHV